MFICMLNLSTFYKILLGTLFIGIPETFYIVMFTLLLVGEFNYWKDERRIIFERWDYIRVFVPVIIGAAVPNILRYAFHINNSLITIIDLFTIFIMLIMFEDIWHDSYVFKWIGKTFFFLMIASLTVVLIEYTYIPFILYGIEKTIKEVNNNILLNFLVSLPAKVSEFSILAFLIAKKRIKLNEKFNFVFGSRILTILASVILAINIIFMMIMVSAIGYDKVLINIPFKLRTLVILSVCIFPVLNITLTAFCIYFSKYGTHKSLTESKIYGNIRNK